MSSANENNCPAESVIKMLAGKWKAQIFRQAVDAPVRFNALLRTLKGANKQSVSLALKEMESEDLLHKNVITQKPLHIEYTLTEKGRSLVPVFLQLESLS